MEQVAIEVSSMSDPDGERRVTAALITVPGVHWATAAHEDGVVAARYDPRQADLEDLREAVEGASGRVAD